MSTGLSQGFRYGARVLATALAVGVAGCDDGKREIRELRSEIQLAYGANNFKKGVELSQQGLKLAREKLGEDASETLYFAQAVTDNLRAAGSTRAAMAALKQEIAIKESARQEEKRLQPRRTLLIQMAEESGDKLTAAEQAVEVSRGIEMARGKDPQPVYRAPTVYPPELYQQKIEGDVEISYSMDATGAIVEARVVSSTPARVFDQVAIDSFRKWRFTPMLDSNGQAVSASGLRFTLAFRLSR